MSQVVLMLQDFHDRAKTINVSEFVEAIDLLESFVCRRSVCGEQVIHASGKVRHSFIQRWRGLDVLRIFMKLETMKQKLTGCMWFSSYLRA